MYGRTMVAVAIVLLAASAVAAEKGGTLPFTKDYDAGLKQAEQTGRPIVIYFTRDG